MVFELPYPPSVNHYWRIWRGRMVIGREGRAYRAMVCSALQGAGVEPLDGPLCVQIELFPPDRRRRDCDNALKALLDALQHAGAYHDDAQIVWLLVVKDEVIRGGKVSVQVWERMSPPADLVIRLPCREN